MYKRQPGNGAILKGYVRDSSGRPVANATVSLQLATTAQIPFIPPESTHTDSDGAYRFASLSAGAYVLRAEMTGYGSAIVSRVDVYKRQPVTLIIGKSNSKRGIMEQRNWRRCHLEALNRSLWHSASFIGMG